MTLTPEQRTQRIITGLRKENLETRRKKAMYRRIAIEAMGSAEAVEKRYGELLQEPQQSPVVVEVRATSGVPKRTVVVK